VKRLLLALISFYRRHISPLTPPSCRFQPTCSAYAREAIERHGAWRGSLLAAWRVLRCNPFTKGGYDPVPPARGARRETAGSEAAEAAAQPDRDDSSATLSTPQQ